MLGDMGIVKNRIMNPPTNVPDLVPGTYENVCYFTSQIKFANQLTLKQGDCHGYLSELHLITRFLQSGEAEVVRVTQAHHC